MHNPPANSCPSNYSATNDNTSSCTGQGPAPQLPSPWHHGTSQAPPAAQATSCPSTYSRTYDLTSTCTSHGPPPALSHLQGNTTTQAPPQATSPFSPTHILTKQPPQKHLRKPGACFCPTTSALSTDIAGTCTSQGPAPALSPIQPPATSQPPPQSTSSFLP